MYFAAHSALYRLRVCTQRAEKIPVFWGPGPIPGYGYGYGYIKHPITYRVSMDPKHIHL